MLPALDRTGLDRIVERVGRAGLIWRQRDVHARAQLLRRCAAGVLAASDEWVALGCRAKGIDPSAPLAGEEWLAGPMTTIRGFRLTADTLDAVEGPETVTLDAGPGGRAVARVFPCSRLDRLVYRGISGEVWIQPGAPPTRARTYRERAASQADGGAALVLGAGNVASIGPLDALTMLVAYGEGVVLKLSPVNDYLRPVFERAFAPLIAEGFLALVTGSGDTGSYLCDHEGVCRVHVTGSRRTYDTIMWGRDPHEREARRASGDVRLAKPVTAELGCVTPILAVPDKWSDADLEFQARHVAATVAHNASFNCVAGKVLVVARGWAQRDAFLGCVSRALARTPARVAYYPGAQDRYRAFCARYPTAQAVGPGRAGVVPWTIIPDVEPRAGEYALTEEAFCGILATVTLDADDAVSFLGQAVPFANQHVGGTLSSMLLVHPRTAEANSLAIEQAVLDLRYGSVAINVWSGVAFGLGTTSWGAYPGHTPEAIGSGVGVVHNSFLFDHPEKSVVRGPFRMWPTPVWFADHRSLLDVGRRMTSFEVRPSWAALPGVYAAALRG